MKWKPNGTKRTLYHKFDTSSLKLNVYFQKIHPKDIKTYLYSAKTSSKYSVMKHCEFPYYSPTTVNGLWENVVYKDKQFLISVNWQVLFKPNEFMYHCTACLKYGVSL